MLSDAGSLWLRGLFTPRLALVVVVILCQACKPAGWDSGVRDVSHSDSGDRPTIAAVFSSSTPTLAPHAKPQFVECAQELGLDFTYYNDEVKDRFFLPEVMGGGLAWLDYDVDGVLDLYAVNGAVLRPTGTEQYEYRNQLFRGQSIGDQYRFVRVTDSAGDAGDRGFGQGCAVGDYNADGFPDLYVTNYGSAVLLRNNGDGTFDDVTREAHVDNPYWGTSSAWLDLNDDGYLDLYVVNYLNVTFENLQVCQFRGKPGYCGPGEYEGQPDRVFVSLGDGQFVEQSAALGLSGQFGKGLAIAGVDLDGDCRPEIYVGNDMTPNFLFTRSRPSFVVGQDSEHLYLEVASPAGCAVSDTGLNEATMGIAVGDYNGDGLVDLFLSHFYQQKNTLYTNLGGLLFKDDSRRTRIAATSYDFLGFGTVALDYDRDGALDIFVANGHVLGPYYDPCQMTPQLLRNDGAGRFDDISGEAGDYFHQKMLGRGVAGADFDMDGDLDIAISHLDRPLALLRNENRTGHFLGVSLQRPDRVPPVGARIVVRQKDRTWVVPYVSGSSYLSSNDSRLLVGLPSEEPVTLTIYWPGDVVHEFQGVAVDRYWRCTTSGTCEPCRVFAP